MSNDIIYAGYESAVSADRGGQDGYNHVFDTDITFPALGEHERLDARAGVDVESLSFPQEASATLKIVDTRGAFKNVVGHYNVGDDGTIRDVSIAFSNTRSSESGLIYNFDIADTAANVSFFMVANGYALNREFSNLDQDDGSFSFVYNKGEEGERLAQITDNADDITLIYEAGAGEISTIRGPVYHSTDSQNDSHINTDGKVHVVSGLVDGAESTVLRIGFEDFPGLGDADYNDVIFDLSVSYLNPYDPSGVLSDISPASGDVSLGGDDIVAPLSGGSYTPDVIVEPNSGVDAEFAAFLENQVSQILPDLYAQVKEGLYQEFGDGMRDDYEQLFMNYLLQNFEHVYNEIKDDFYGLETDIVEISDSYHDVIAVSDHIDEAISNFIHLNPEGEGFTGEFSVQPEPSSAVALDVYTSEGTDFSLYSEVSI